MITEVAILNRKVAEGTKNVISDFDLKGVREWTMQIPWGRMFQAEERQMQRL